MIYFIQTNGAIKIGYTIDIKRRLSDLQVGSPDKLKVLGTIPGDVGFEGVLHKCFLPERKNGEWFSISGRLYRFIDRVCNPPVYEIANNAHEHNAEFWGKPDEEYKRRVLDIIMQGAQG